jgi:hypothetical protein
MRVSRVRLRRASRVLLVTLELAGVQASLALAQTAQDIYAQRWVVVSSNAGKQTFIRNMVDNNSFYSQCSAWNITWIVLPESSS